MIFIGKGEKWAVKILKELTNLDEITDMEIWGKPGIYTQVPMRNLIRLEYYKILSQEQRRSSADIVIVTNNHKIIVIRIQGKGHGEGWFKGQGKNQFDTVQEFYLLESDCIVISPALWNCPNLLKEKDFEEAKKEILYMLNSAGQNELVCFSN